MRGKKNVNAPYSKLKHELVKALVKEGFFFGPWSFFSAVVNGFNPGEKYVRIALVYDFETTEEALKRINNLL